MNYPTHRGNYKQRHPSGWRGRSSAAYRAGHIRPTRQVFISYPQLLLALVCATATVGLSWQIIAISAGRSFTLAGQFETALAWDGSSAAALDAVAEQDATKASTSEQARKAALNVLSVAPLDDRAFAVLALDANRRGRQALAAKLMRVAGARSWRDQIAQAWLFSSDVAQKQYLSSLEHLDALLRLDEDNMGPLIPLVASFTILPASSAALGTYLGRSPPWRSVVLKNLAARLRSRDNLVRVFDDLQRTLAPPTEDETASLLNRLVKDGQYGLARQVAANLNDETSRSHAWLYNGEFSLPLNGSPFNWLIASQPGVQIDLARTTGGTGALRLDFAGRVPRLDVQQIVTLPPGLWSLSGEVRTVELQSDMGVGWQLACADSDKQLTKPKLETGNFDWKQFSLEFRVPEEGCAAQRLTLVHPARVASEEVIQGQIWYRNLKIGPEMAGARP